MTTTQLCSWPKASHSGAPSSDMGMGYSAGATQEPSIVVPPEELDASAEPDPRRPFVSLS